MRKIILIGRLGRDVEIRYTPNGDAVCDISVASTVRRKGEDVTEWFKVTLWRQMAENASKYLQKGSQVFVEGQLDIERFTKRDGTQGFSLKVAASNFQMLGSGSDRTDERSGLEPKPGPDDEIPF